MSVDTFFVNPNDRMDNVRFERMSLPKGAILRRFGEHHILTFDMIVYEIPEQEDGTPASLGTVFVKDHGNVLPTHAYIVGYVEGRTRRHTFISGQHFDIKTIKDFAWEELKRRKKERKKELEALGVPQLEKVLEGHTAVKPLDATKENLIRWILKEEKLLF